MVSEHFSFCTNIILSEAGDQQRGPVEIMLFYLSLQLILSELFSEFNS